MHHQQPQQQRKRHRRLRLRSPRTKRSRKARGKSPSLCSTCTKKRCAVFGVCGDDLFRKRSLIPVVCQKKAQTPSGRGVSRVPCRYFFGTGHCLRGDDCPFSHGPRTLQTQQSLGATRFFTFSLSSAIVEICSDPPSTSSAAVRDEWSDGNAARWNGPATFFPFPFPFSSRRARPFPVFCTAVSAAAPPSAGARSKSAFLARPRI